MSYQGQSPKVNRLRLNPRSTDPVNPSEGDLQYADGSVRGEGLWVYKNGNWTPAGSGDAGVKNYLGTINAVDLNGDFELGTVGNWVLGNTSLDSIKLPTGSPTFGSGASANLSTAIVGSPNQLSGSYSLSYISSAATTAGNLLASPVFTIDQSDQAKPLTISFSYKVASGTIDASGTSANSLGVAIYDVTNSSWIVPAGVFAITQTSGVGKAVATFQTASNGSQHRLVVYNANATSGAVTMYFDDFSVSPVVSVLGAVSTDYVNAGTMTISALGGGLVKGTVNTDVVYWRREGQFAHITYSYYHTAAGTSGTGDYVISLPAGLKIDTSLVPLYSTASGGTTLQFTAAAQTSKIECDGQMTSSSGYNYNSVSAYAYSATQFRLATFHFTTGAASTTWGGYSAGFAFGNTALSVNFTIKVPIAGWSSNVQMSNDTDTRVVAASYSKSATQALTANVTNITFPNKRFDTHSAFDGTTFTAPVTGIYRISGSGLAATAAAALNIRAYIDGNASILLGQSNSNGGDYATLSGLVSLNAGQALTLRSTTSVTVGVTNIPEIAFERLSGPAVVAATESVNARYYASSTTITGSLATVSWTTKDFDSHGSMASGVYTVPVSGKYQVNAQITLSGTFALNTQTNVQLQKNNAAVSENNYYASAATTNQTVAVNDIISCNAGDTIRLQVSSAATSPAIVSSNTKNFISITKVGN